MKSIKIPLLARVVIAIVLGIMVGCWCPEWIVRLAATFNAIFGNLLSFFIPLIIVGLVTPAIGGIGKNAGRMLLLTVILAYADTVCSGLLTYGVSYNIFPSYITPDTVLNASETKVEPFFNIEIPPMFDVMSALVLAFTIGLGIAFLDSKGLKRGFDEFGDIIARTIAVVIVPLLPVYIFGIFSMMAFTGQVWHIVKTFLSIILIIFAMHIGLLVLQYIVAGLIARRNPFKALYTMLPAYFTALGNLE